MMIPLLIIPALICQSPIGSDPIQCDITTGIVTIKGDKVLYLAHQMPHAVPTVINRLPFAIYKGKAVKDTNGFMRITGAVNEKGDPLGDILIDWVSGEMRIKLANKWKIY